ncbi:AAA family ATPase [Streptomyces longispororuber]|uniref:AAA family ATPase n=1 Tax=Streptomyces longispororuber TaxID=68230 RepID=UPI00210D5D5C|nr:AAA family ATPase [Streptomyces longispororuber]MCQ4207690.1 helix-turn-helix domain-containing protein [Streptomyces longispororuber]
MTGSASSSFAAALRETRVACGLTLEELSEKSGVSDRSIGNMERGHTLAPRRRTVAALVDAMGLTTDQRRTLTQLAQASRSPVPASAPAAVSGAAIASGRLAPPPRRPPVFVGREDEVRSLAAVLRDDRDGPPAVTLYGPPGAGKTTLALHMAEQVRDAFPDGTLFADLGGTDENPPNPSSVLLALLSGMGVPDGELLREDTGARMRRYHDLTRQRRHLIVLDNASDEAQVRPLLPYAGRTGVLVTARHPLSGLETSRTALGPLHRSDSLALLTSLIGEQRTKDAASTEAVAGLCADLPLALRIAANWLITRESWGIDQLVARLRDEDRRIAALSAGDLALGPAFSLSYRRLTPEAAAALRALGTTAPYDVGSALLAATLGVPDDEAADLLDELVETGWLRTSQPGRYRIYDLLRLYARRRLLDEEGPEAETVLHERAHGWLLSQVRATGRCFEPGYGPDQDAPAHHPTASLENAADWLRAEAGHWWEAYRWAAATGRHQEVVDTAESLHWFSDNWMLWDHWTELFATAATAAHAQGDRRMEATHRNYHAWALTALEVDPESGLQQARTALAIAEDCGDIVQQAWAHFYCSWTLRHLGSEEAISAAAAATALFTEADEPNGLLSAYNTEVRCMLHFDKVEAAVPLIERTMRLISGPTADARIPEHIRGFAWKGGMEVQGNVAIRLRQWEKAERCVRESLKSSPSDVVPVRAAHGHNRLAYVLDQLGRHEEAAQERDRARVYDGHTTPDALLDHLEAAGHATGEDDRRSGDDGQSNDG